ncbi:MAG: sigma-70 family RNA polymerase sigma factor, partial [Planctomycetia bacterium]|nr:sigma-70 family RNA polymerase sigma factor [Planctomycetia bacterium]
MLDLDFNLNKFCGKTDEELAVMAKCDRSAVDALILRFFNLIFIKAEIFLSNASDADDLWQEGVMGLLRAIASFDPERAVKFSTYAEVCIVNCMKSYAAKCDVKSRNIVSFDEIQSETASQEKNPESIYIDKEFFSELWRIIDNELSVLERQVFTLFIQGDGYRQIADELG